MRIGIDCDEAAFELKELINDFLTMQPRATQSQPNSVEAIDIGIHRSDPVHYPDIEIQVAEAVAAGDCDRGILLCGTGLGMAIAANKVPGVRAATCHDVYSAERAQRSNNAQIITLGGRVVGPELAKVVVAIWLAAEFGGGGSARKVEKIGGIEQKYAHHANVAMARGVGVVQPQTREEAK